VRGAERTLLLIEEYNHAYLNLGRVQPLYFTSERLWRWGVIADVASSEAIFSMKEASVRAGRGFIGTPWELSIQ
jgi:hypothetical protein